MAQENPVMIIDVDNLVPVIILVPKDLHARVEAAGITDPAAWATLLLPGAVSFVEAKERSAMRRT